jgi:hypothetical protein
MLSETDPAVMWIVAGPSHSTSTTPFAPGWRPWLQAVLELLLPELPATPLALALAGAPVAAFVPDRLAATVLVPEEPHPAMASRTDMSSVALETAVLVRDI